MFTVNHIAPLKIPNGATSSNIITMEAFEDAEVLDFYAPASVNGATAITLMVTPDPLASPVVWSKYTTDGSAAWALPGAGNSRSLTGFAFRGMQLVCTLAPSADTSFALSKKFRIY